MISYSNLRYSHTPISPEHFHKLTKRIATTSFIKDVDFAFKGKNQKSFTYWLNHLTMLIFFIIRGILVLNTPDIVHVPRITIQQNEIPSEDHYQFRNDLKNLDSWISYNFCYFIWFTKRPHTRLYSIASVTGWKSKKKIIISL